MVPVDGRPMLTWALDALDQAGVDRAVIVVGYLEEVVRETYGERYRGISIQYVSNPDYATTNNLYTLFLAREHFNDDVLLLEADLVYDPGLIAALLAHPGQNVAVVDDFTEALNGTCVTRAREGSDQISKFILGKDQGEAFDRSSALKTVNLYKLAGTMLQTHYLPAVERWVATQRTDQYYEAVLADLVNSSTVDMQLLTTGAHRWFEVDTPEDLELAKALFHG
jgi:choline kinase